MRRYLEHRPHRLTVRQRNSGWRRDNGVLGIMGPASHFGDRGFAPVELVVDARRICQDVALEALEQAGTRPSWVRVWRKRTWSRSATTTQKWLRRQLLGEHEHAGGVDADPAGRSPLRPPTSRRRCG